MIKSTSLPKPHFLLRMRNRHFLLLDVLILCVTPTLALVLRVDDLQALDNNYALALLLYTAVALAIRLAVFRTLGLYSRYWRYASIDEMIHVVTVGLISAMLIMVVYFGVRIPALGICGSLEPACILPRSLPFIDAMLVLLAIGATRFSVRAVDLHVRHDLSSQSLQRVLIAGAGEAGTMIVRELNANPQIGLYPIGFVDDDPQKHGTRIRSLPVLGDRNALPRLVEQHKIDQVIIAMPTAPGKTIREVLTICEQAGIPAKTMPGMYELLGGQVSVSQLRNVQIEDLLRRDPVETDTAAVWDLLQGRCVLVTGGGGSIGSELCRQILRCQPSKLVIAGHGENSVFEIEQELRRKLRGSVASSANGRRQHMQPEIAPVIVDVRFAERLHNVFQQHRPQIVFHAAAHKHVPLMEDNPGEAITNNVLGTRNVLDASLACGVEQLVLISTDKAVNPTSIMGASKRVAELLVHQAAERSGLPYCAVRFGNVLGSRGSVVLTFKQQIAAGGPVTVTDPQMTRFFMTIPEAVQLVLQAAVLGQGGEAFVLDMGEPVRIVDLARDLISLSGLEEGRDIDIAFTGLRPGEKLFEELFVAGEDYQRTAHQKIFIANNASHLASDGLDLAIEALIAVALGGDEADIRRELGSLVPEFRRPDAGDSAQLALSPLPVTRALATQPAIPGSVRAMKPQTSTG
jgi:FlaA1/EpsC-like NDP-sugar epimerase